MFIYVSKDPYCYVYGDHEGVHKNAKVPYGLKLETISGEDHAADEPYDSAYEVKPPPTEYSTGLGYSPYPDNWIAVANVSLAPIVVPEPPDDDEPGEPDYGDGDLANLVGILRFYGIKSITLE